MDGMFHISPFATIPKDNSVTTICFIMFVIFSDMFLKIMASPLIMSRV